MNALEYNNIVDKLSIQVKSIQEGFSILSGSSTIRELGRNFSRILRGTLLLNDVSVFYKQNLSAEWEDVFVNNLNSGKALFGSSLSREAKIEYFSDGEYCAIASLPLIDGSYWGLVFGSKIDRSEISELDRIVLQMFLQLLDNSYQSFLNQKREKQLNFSLNHRVAQLNSLIDTGIEISKLQKSSSLLNLALERASALTNASRGVIYLSRGSEVLYSIGFPGSQDIEKVAASVNKIEASVEFNGITYNVILSEKESRNGLMDFDATDELLLQALARQILAALENEYLHDEAVEKERMHQEIETAAAIQRRIIPQILPDIEGYDLAGINIPSLEIGGDYYDVIKLKNDKYLLIIADVSGKGVASGLLVNTLNASLNVYVENGFHLAEMAERLNKIIFKASTPEKYITCFIAVLDPGTGSLEYLNAGHNPIFLSTQWELKKLDKGGFAFGMLDFGLPYETGIISMEPGDKILFYTDGITEAMNTVNEEYTDERLEQFIIEVKCSSAESFIKSLIEDVKKHTVDTPQSDDITALFLIRK
ncbi:MAG: PP2C family protein-serine/threonine phosphatase [Melioribacteraceae bacterium]